MNALRAVLAAAAVGLLIGPPLPAGAIALPAPIVVNWFSDEIDADVNDGLCLSTPSGKCTLRAAVMHTNDSPSPDTILLSAGVYVLNRPGNDDTNIGGDLDISGDLTIRGVGMDSTTILLDNTSVNDRVLHVLSGNVRLEALGLTGGYSQGAGAGLWNMGTLALDYTHVYSNAAFYAGGNAAGGLYNTGLLTLTHSLVDHNAAYTFGGGLDNSGTAWIEASTIANNTALGYYGGGIHNTGVLWLTNSTLSGNQSPDDGSGLQNDSTGTTNAYNVTITANIANTDLDPTGDDAGVKNNAPGVVNLRNSLVARNYELVLGVRYYDDCAGTLNMYGNNYFSPLGYSPPKTVVSPCTFNYYSGNAYVNIGGGEILPLGDYGGPTPTHDIAPDSDAYDGGDPAVGCIGSDSQLLRQDQRGVPRVAGVRCDAGAVEHGSLWAMRLPFVQR